MSKHIAAPTLIVQDLPKRHRVVGLQRWQQFYGADSPVTPKQGCQLSAVCTQLRFRHDVKWRAVAGGNADGIAALDPQVSIGNRQHLIDVASIHYLAGAGTSV